MPLFRYTAVLEKGKKEEGTIDADSLQAAKLKLVRRQIPVIQIVPLTEKQRSVALSKTDVLNLTREMGRLLDAGLPLFEALSALEEKYRKQKAHRLFIDLCDQVRSGVAFSTSLSHHPESFDLLYVAMIANAEKTGTFSRALQELVQLISRQLHVRKQLMAALLYPALLSGFCLFVFSALLFYVVPSLKGLFEGRSLHPFTELVFGASALACAAKPYLLTLGLGLSCGAAALRFSKKGKQKAVGWILGLPFLKSLFAKVAFVRFCRATATLLEGGVPVIEAFSQARRTLRHPLLEAVIQQAESRIMQGEPIHAAFQNHPLIPPLIPRMLAIAAEGGKLPFMLHQIAQIYEEELEKTLSQFATMAQPILLLVLGLIVGFVLLSVMLPLTDVSSFATS